MMLHTKYQGSRPCGFRQEDFSLFSSLSKTSDPRAEPFLTPGILFKNLGKGPLGDATYQISRL